MKRLIRKSAVSALAVSLVAGSFLIGPKAYSASPERGKQKQTGGKKMTEKSVLDFKARSLSGEEIDLSRYKGKVLVIVNTASKCGFTNQYAGLEELYEKYKDKGLEILGFPCNQFGGQEPGSEEEIAK